MAARCYAGRCYRSPSRFGSAPDSATQIQRLEPIVAYLRQVAKASIPRKPREYWPCHTPAVSLAKQALSHLSYGPLEPEFTGPFASLVAACTAASCPSTSLITALAQGG